MHRGRTMGEPFDHRPPGWIRQSCERCTQSIHNRMVVDCRLKSSVNFAIADFYSRTLYARRMKIVEGDAGGADAAVPPLTSSRMGHPVPASLLPKESNGEITGGGSPRSFWRKREESARPRFRFRRRGGS